jgi:hypothetical protein
MTRLFGLVAAGTLVAGSVQAQTCMGFSSFTAGSMNVSALAEFADAYTGWGGQLNIGHGGGKHILGVKAVMNMPDADGADNTTTLGGHLGLNMSTSSGIEWCPVVNVNYTTGEPKVLGFGGHLGIGKALGSMGSFSLVPFGMAGYSYAKADCDGCEGDGDIDLAGGLGFRFNNGMQITPSVYKSMAEGSKAVFRAAVTFPLGGM